MRHELTLSLSVTARCNTSVVKMKFAYNVWTHHLSGKTDHEEAIKAMSSPTAPSLFYSMGNLLPSIPAHGYSPHQMSLFSLKKHSLLSLDEVYCFVAQSSHSLFLSIFTWLCSAFCNMHRAQQSYCPCLQSQSSPTRVQGPTAVDVWRTLLPHSEQESTLELLS